MENKGLMESVRTAWEKEKKDYSYLPPIPTEKRTIVVYCGKELMELFKKYLHGKTN